MAKLSAGPRFQVRAKMSFRPAPIYYILEISGKTYRFRAFEILIKSPNCWGDKPLKGGLYK